MYIYFFPIQELYHSNKDITIADERLQMVDLCSASIYFNVRRDLYSAIATYT